MASIPPFPGGSQNDKQAAKQSAGNTGRSNWELSYQLSPITLVGGIAGAGTGQIPIISLINSQNYPNGLTQPASGSSGSGAFVNFNVLSGGSLIENEVATYPLANQVVAANAIIVDPLKISLEMVFPATSDVPLGIRQALITALKGKLDQHIAQGGWYNVATPAFIYQGCLLESLIDGSDDGVAMQPQQRWIWNFTQPLITNSALQPGQNPTMNNVSSQTYQAGTPSPSTVVGQPASNTAQNIVPAASGPIASNVAPSGASAGGATVSAISPIVPSGLV